MYISLLGIVFVKFVDQNQIVSRKGIYRALPYQSLSKQPSLPLRHTTTIPSQAKDSTETERVQAAEKTEAERKKEERLCHTKLKLQKTQKLFFCHSTRAYPNIFAVNNFVCFRIRYLRT